MSAYTLSDYRSKSGHSIKASLVPDDMLALDINIEKNTTYRPQYDRVIKMTALALQDVEDKLNNPISQAIPLILALPENIPNVDQTPPHLLLKNILTLSNIPIDGSKVQGIPTGRAAGLQAIALAEQERLLYEGQVDGFVIGEGASFLLLTRHAECAMQQDNHIIAINPVGIADEHGHLDSDTPYRGDGLDQAKNLSQLFRS